jgi:hypothetical protein
VVINPCNGPGPDDLPDENYRREVVKLTCHANVKVVGYIHFDWGKRDLSLLFRDIDVYARWPDVSGLPGLMMAGIFVDETPNAYSDEAERSLTQLRSHVKQMPGGDENVVCHQSYIAGLPHFATFAHRIN